MCYTCESHSYRNIASKFCLNYPKRQHTFDSWAHELEACARPCHKNYPKLSCEESAENKQTQHKDHIRNPNLNPTKFAGNRKVGLATFCIVDNLVLVAKRTLFPTQPLCTCRNSKGSPGQLKLKPRSWPTQTTWYMISIWSIIIYLICWATRRKVIAESWMEGEVDAQPSTQI